MQTVSVQQARKDISRLLDVVAGGDDVIITRCGKPAATLTGVASTSGKTVSFPDRTAFRRRFPEAKTGSTQLIREIREEKG